ncbi:MAG: RNA 2',3'-cyclic phosphodiesterase [Candidatus Marinimicrobia bacterium]|nr:RNA 2',3'-cyclic phosphodiesterase [Candidatus Neomarinimicrobiota bacterium]
MKRTFISIPIPSRVLGIKQMLVSTFEDPSEIKWVKNINLHLTLKFLGDTKDESVEKINAVLSKIAPNVLLDDLTISNTGCFPNIDRPTVLWLGIEGDTQSLIQLVDKINTRLESIGIPINEEPYTPHITIARIKYTDKKPPDAKIFLQSKYDGIALNANQMQFVSSELSQDGPIYNILGSHSFGA